MDRSSFLGSSADVLSAPLPITPPAHVLNGDSAPGRSNLDVPAPSRSTRVTLQAVPPDSGTGVAARSRLSGRDLPYADALRNLGVGRRSSGVRGL
jgi:hypothetical protein